MSPTLLPRALCLCVLVGLATGSASLPSVPCTGTCVVNSSTIPGYDPPVLVIANNTTVVWHATDIGHNQRDTETPLGSPGACFHVAAPGQGDSPGVRFTIAGPELRAAVGETTEACGNAVALPDGGFSLLYHCTLHGNMRAQIVVQA